MSSADETLKRIRSIVRGAEIGPSGRGRLPTWRGAWGITGGVGVYDVGEEVVSIIAWSGGAYSSASSGASGGAYREAGGGCRQDADTTKTRDRQRDGLKAVSTKAVLELSDNE